MIDTDSYRIGSFNIQKFHENTYKKIGIIKKIIKDNSIDILAIQEIFSKGALDKLLAALGTEWDGRWDSPNSRSVSAAEGYAFVWNKQRIDLSRRKNGEAFEPVIHNQYPHKNGMTLIRNPFYGRFVLKANKMTEIRLLNTHIMFSQKREENESDDHDSSEKLPGDVTKRKRELEILSKYILPKIENKDYDRFWNEMDDICRKPCATILLGDYNLNLRASGAKDTFIDEPFFIITDGKSQKRIVTVQSDLTTLKAKPKDGGPIKGYANNFDHFTYNDLRPISTKCWAVDVPNDPQYYAGDLDKYKKDVSDHLMIVMELSLI
ncbi:MAG: hypothetical protein IKO61_01890 [Lachnospiraceae bacterium]|nr:hypothetical protein [Lachnospiraceae bacterium]